MIGYASNTRTARNLAALAQYGWRILLTPDNPRPPRGFRYAIDNGAWKAFRQSMPFDEIAFRSLLCCHGAAADFVVIPDLIAEGERSFRYSLTWLSRMEHVSTPLLAVQDGMTPETVRSFLVSDPRAGIFLGGSTEWKLSQIRAWGVFAAELGRYYHVGRVNTGRRIRLCEEAGAFSFDGTSATLFSCTLPHLDHARRATNLFNPRRMSHF